MTDPYSNPTASDHLHDIKGSLHDAGDAAHSAISDAKSKLGAQSGEKVDTATTTAGASLQQIAEQLRQAGDNLGEDQGWARQGFVQGAAGLERVSSYLRDGKMDDFARDLQSFARGNPAAFLAGSVALGFLAARVAKAAAERAGAPDSNATPAPSPQVTAAPSVSALDEPRSYAPAGLQASDPGAGFGGETN